MDLNPATLVFKDLKCQNCGAILKYQPGTKNLVCTYCGTNNEIEVSGEVLEEINYEQFIATGFESQDTQTVVLAHCQSCGASTTLPPNVTASECPFCGRSLVVKNASTCEVLKPKGLLPFNIDHKAAHQKYSDWLHGLWFAPNNLKRHASQPDKLIGIYIPYWTYDSQTDSTYNGLRGDNYTTYVTQPVTVNGQTSMQQVPVVKVRWSPASGRVRVFFDDVLVVACTSLPADYINNLEPFDLMNLEPFNEKYLSGFRAERYQVEVKDGLVAAKVRMDVAIRQSVKQQIGGDVQQITTLNTNFYDITFKHILLPIFISAYRYNGKVYRFLVNGRTGKVTGERPLSYIKIALTIIAVIAIIALIMYLTQQN